MATKKSAAKKSGGKSVASAVAPAAKKMMSRLAQPDAITLLKADHKTVRALLETLNSTESASKRTKVLGQIEVELMAHAKVEEEIFYPAFRRAAENSEEMQMFFEAKEEHGLVDVILPKTKAADPASDEFAARANVLKELVFHHAKEEEKDMFKAAKSIFSKDELKTLGEQMQRRKKVLVRELRAAQRS